MKETHFLGSQHFKDFFFTLLKIAPHGRTPEVFCKKTQWQPLVHTCQLSFPGSYEQWKIFHQRKKRAPESLEYL